jgi:hypothetical protein
MAYPSDMITPSQVVDLANKDANRLVGPVAEFVVRREPYSNTVSSGTLPNVSTLVRSVVAERALPAASLARPVFVPDEQICGQAGGTTQVGTTEFQYQLRTLRERGPKVCVKTTRTAWASSYPAIINSLKEAIKEVTGADIRAQYLDQGGCKLVANSTAPFSGAPGAFAGDINAVGTLFPNLIPDSPMSFRGLEYTATYVRETLQVDPYDGEESEGGMLCIASQDSIQLFRDELDIREDIRALTTGRYALGQETIQGYKFQGPYHGIGWGIDPRPLRCTTLNTVVVGGVTYLSPVLLEPYVAVQVSTGFAARPNPAWVGATYEFMFLIGKNGFRRLTPESYKIPGFDFSAPISNNGLQFRQLIDADANFWGDFGQHIYEIARAFKPEHPHAIIGILYKRPTASLALTPG